MNKQTQRGKAPNIDPEVLQRIASTLKPINTPVIYKRNERSPLIALSSPARGRFTAHGIRLVGDLAAYWGQESRNPQALQATESDVPGFVLMEPVQIFDPAAPDQYPITWSDGYRQAHINLRPIMQPRNLEAPQGYVREIPISLHKLPNVNKYYLFLHTGETTVRPEAEVAPEEQQDFTASRDNPADATAAGEIDPGEDE